MPALKAQSYLHASDEGRRRLAAIMFTDMVGYTALSQSDEQEALRLLEVQRQLVQSLVQTCSGEVIKTVGDGTLIEFPSALEAVKCAANIQAGFHGYNLDHPGQEIRLRIGIHIGDVIHREGDIFGDAVNIASRIEPLAEPEGICITEQVYSQVRNKINFPMSKLPPQRLRNIEISIELYRLMLPWQETSRVVQESRARIIPPQASYKRITSGIPGLDFEIGGGFPEGTTTMVYGAPQTGKSTFSYHYLMESIRMNQPCLFLMTDYDTEELTRATSSFGWDIKDTLKSGLVRALVITSAMSEEQAQILEPPVTSSGVVLQSPSLSASIADLGGIVAKSAALLNSLSSQDRKFRVVLDSLSSLFIYNPPILVAKFLRQFSFKMKAMGALGIIITHVDGSIDPQSELLIKSSVDNLIHLFEGEFDIEGMVGTPKIRMPYKITGQGFQIEV